MSKIVPQLFAVKHSMRFGELLANRDILGTPLFALTALCTGVRLLPRLPFIFLNLLSGIWNIFYLSDSIQSAVKSRADVVIGMGYNDIEIVEYFAEKDPS